MVCFNAKATDATKRKIDDFISLFAIALKHHSDHDRPFIDFPRGVTSLKKLKAHEHVGVLFVYMLALHCEDFLCIFYGPGGGMSLDEEKQFHDLFEMLLCFHQWMRQETISRTVCQQCIKPKLRQLMHSYKLTCNWTIGKGLKTPKFHQMLHVPDYILRFGPPSNYHSGPSESNANILAKQQANRTSRTLSTFEQEVSMRLSEHICIDAHICECLNQTPAKQPPKTKSWGGTQFKIMLSDDDNETTN